MYRTAVPTRRTSRRRADPGGVALLAPEEPDAPVRTGPGGQVDDEPCDGRGTPATGGRAVGFVIPLALVPVREIRYERSGTGQGRRRWIEHPDLLGGLDGIRRRETSVVSEWDEPKAGAAVRRDAV